MPPESKVIHIEWPTIAVALAIYGGLGLLTWNHAQVPVWLLPLLGGYLVCWHGSLQHEVVHGHPTPWRWLNRALVALPVGLWMPYRIYEDTHLEHHRSELTVPGRDPESFYVPRRCWAAMPLLRRAALGFNNTLLGRLSIGPLLVVARLAREELPRLREGARVWLWLHHLAGVSAVLGWTVWVCDIPVWLYLLAFAWPGLSLTLLRSFHEHQPSACRDDRTNSVRAPALVRLLFLNNNFHVAHHTAPGMPWYQLPRRFPETRWDSSYARLFAHSWQRKDSPAHPFA